MLKINDIYKNLRTNIPKNILSGNSKIIVGFSGGPDSRLLIDFLCRSIQNPEKNIIATHAIVIALNEVVITFIPVYCNTERYNPNFTNNGVATIGTRINNQ